MDLLKASITEEYRQAAALMKTGIDDGRLLESAARDLQEIILLHKTDQANLKFTNEWTCALLEVLQETPVDKIDELSSDEQAIFNCLLIDEPAKELAHVLAGHLSLQAAGSAVVLASSLPSLAALGSPEKAEIKMVFNTGRK
jgi:hypothetical protein